MSDSTDDAFYSPNRKPPAARKPTPGEPLWSLRYHHITWSCELRFHGESYGWEGQILRNGELFTARGAFVLKGDAIRWAEEQRKDAERGWPE
jgi:hypothetical protein